MVECRWHTQSITSVGRIPCGPRSCLSSILILVVTACGPDRKRGRQEYRPEGNVRQKQDDAAIKKKAVGRRWVRRGLRPRSSNGQSARQVPARAKREGDIRSAWASESALGPAWVLALEVPLPQRPCTHRLPRSAAAGSRQSQCRIGPQSQSSSPTSSSP
jgi:hypothetical protein